MANDYLIYGKHTVLAALLNPRRKCKELWLTPSGEVELRKGGVDAAQLRIRTNIVINQELTKLFPNIALHNGMVLKTEYLAQPTLSSFLAQLNEKHSTIILLDQVSDPHNLGAILRVAAAFSAAAVFALKDNSVRENATVAKVASGALEKIPLLTITNLASTIDTLKKHKFWIVGLDTVGTHPLTAINDFERTALIFGNEGEGLRALTKKNCDILSRIPISSQVESLNVATSVAIALYERSAL